MSKRKDPDRGYLDYLLSSIRTTRLRLAALSFAVRESRFSNGAATLDQVYGHLYQTLSDQQNQLISLVMIEGTRAVVSERERAEIDRAALRNLRIGELRQSARSGFPDVLAGDDLISFHRGVPDEVKDTLRSVLSYVLLGGELKDVVRKELVWEARKRLQDERDAELAGGLADELAR